MAPDVQNIAVDIGNMVDNERKTEHNIGNMTVPKKG